MPLDMTALQHRQLIRRYIYNWYRACRPYRYRRQIIHVNYTLYCRPPYAGVFRNMLLLTSNRFFWKKITMMTSLHPKKKCEMQQNSKVSNVYCYSTHRNWDWQLRKKKTSQKLTWLFIEIIYFIVNFSFSCSKIATYLHVCYMDIYITLLVQHFRAYVSWRFANKFADNKTTNSVNVAGICVLSVQSIFVFSLPNSWSISDFRIYYKSVSPVGHG